MPNPLESASLPDDLAEAVAECIRTWADGGKMRRLWARDATLWTGGPEADWLGWLDIADRQIERVDELERLRDQVREAGFSDALLLGMGGSSLAPEVLAQTFGTQAGSPVLHVLDSTDPAQVRAFEQAVDLERTIAIVSSKSGSTLEPNVFRDYFLTRMGELLGAEEAGKRFIAVTDPGSALEAAAQAAGFRTILHGLPSIGGRYSALSDFGMGPGAVAGLPVRAILERAREMGRACGPDAPVEENPGLALGLVLGLAQARGRDKLTIVTSAGVADLGAWLEQLIAESTGKRGTGIIPVDREPLGAPEAYGDDRVFAHLRLADDEDAANAAALDALAAAGHPVVRMVLRDPADLGAEFFRWEIATAVAGAELQIDPFDQPDVEAAKIAARELTDAYEETGALPEEEPFWEGEGVKLFAAPGNAAALSDADGLTGHLAAHLRRAGAGDYVALLAFVQMTAEHEAVLTRIRTTVRDRLRVATCVGFGPRFLHSTGQAYKGGPRTGVFLQITCDDAEDLPVPGRRYTFGVIKAAQARGDLTVLEERGSRALRVHLGPDVTAGLNALAAAVDAAL